MLKPFMSNNDILSMFQLRTSTGLFMSTLVDLNYKKQDIGVIKEKHIMHKLLKDQISTNKWIV